MRVKDLNKQEAIARKAIEMIVKEGFDGLSMHKLAKAAGVSVATIYIYYKDREDLLLQLYVNVMKQWNEEIMKDFDPDADFETGMRIQWRNRAAYIISYPTETWFMEQFRHSPLHGKAFELIGGAFKGDMKRFIQNAVAKKQLVQLPFEVYWSVAFAPLYQLVRFKTHGRSQLNDNFVLTEDDIELALSLVIKALTP
jgi:AcrR family transcriptional regulator